MDAVESAEAMGFHSLNDQAIPIYPECDDHADSQHDQIRPHEPLHAVLSWHPMP